MPSTATDPPLPHLPAWIAATADGLLERGTAARLVLLAALAGEHVLLIGPPGTAKSALARRLQRAFDGARWFERLLTRFSTPEELFGPLSLKALEHDRYERLVDGFLPTAGIAFLDEVFKANSAILNALLTLLNEREFDNGTERLRTPLVSVVGASNEVPTDEALVAFHDRFLVRVPVAPVGDDAFGALLALPPDAADGRDVDASRLPPPISAGDRAALRERADTVSLGEDFVAACHVLRRWLAQRGAALSDRRWRQFAGLARTAAATEARDRTDALDLWLAPYVAAAQPADVAPLARWFDTEVLALPPARAPWLERAVEAFEQQLTLEQSMPADEGGGDAAGKLALARAIGLGSGGAAGGGDEASMAARRIVSERLESRLRRRFSPMHVQARTAQVAEIRAQVDEALAELRSRSDAMAATLGGRLWLPPELAGRIAAAFDAAQANLSELTARLAACEAGFAELPVDADSDAVEPAAIRLDVAPVDADVPATAAPVAAGPAVV